MTRCIVKYPLQFLNHISIKEVLHDSYWKEETMSRSTDGKEQRRQ